jgi:hypothetical protein
MQIKSFVIAIMPGNFRPAAIVRRFISLSQTLAFEPVSQPDRLFFASDRHYSVCAYEMKKM